MLRIHTFAALKVLPFYCHSFAIRFRSCCPPQATQNAKKASFLKDLNQQNSKWCFKFWEWCQNTNIWISLTAIWNFLMANFDFSTSNFRDFVPLVYSIEFSIVFFCMYTQFESKTGIQLQYMWGRQFLYHNMYTKSIDVYAPRKCDHVHKAIVIFLLLTQRKMIVWANKPWKCIYLI